MVLSVKSNKNLRTNSSTNDDLPAPPVPVIPSTGVFMGCLVDWFISVSTVLNASGSFSAAEIKRAIDL